MAINVEELEAVRNLVIRLTGQLDELKANKKNVDEMYKNLFDNDEALTNLTEQAKAWQKQLKDRKISIAASGEAVDLKVKIEDYAEDIKMITESLNTHLLNLYTLTGSMSFDVSPTVEREYTVKARVKGKAKEKKNAPAKGQLTIDGGEIV